MRVSCLCLFALAACAPFPELDGSISAEARAAPFPTLTALPDVAPAAAAPAVAAGLADRIARLNARAARLREYEQGPLQ